MLKEIAQLIKVQKSPTHTSQLIKDSVLELMKFPKAFGLTDEDQKLILQGQLKERGFENYHEVGQILFDEFIKKVCQNDLALVKSKIDEWMRGLQVALLENYSIK